MRSMVFIFCTLVFGAQNRFLAPSDTIAASQSSPRKDVQTKIETQNDTANVSSSPPGTNFHNQTEHAEVYSLDLKVTMGPLERQLYDEMLSKGSVYFEFGLGGSTLFAAQHSNLNHITAVDSSKEWIGKVQSEAPIAAGIRSGRISIAYVAKKRLTLS